MTKKRKSKKRVQAGKEASKTRKYHAYLAEEKERLETPYRYRVKKAGRGLLKFGKAASKFIKKY
jgi:hypothetical protein